MSSRLFAMLLWALAAASVVFWAMRLATSAAPIPDGTRLAMNGPIAGGDLSRLLGAPRVEAAAAAAPPPAAASRFKLTGIVSTSGRRGHDDGGKPGVALISIDGGPVRAFRVGEVLDSQLSLWSVALRSARIGDRSGNGAEAFVLELPAPEAPATGTLSAAVAPALQPTPMSPAPVFGAAAPPAVVQPLPPPLPAELRPGRLTNDGRGIPQIQPGMAPSASAASRQGVPESAVMRQ